MFLRSGGIDIPVGATGEIRPYEVRCSPAPIRGAGSSSRSRRTLPLVSALDAAHHPAMNAVASAASGYESTRHPSTRLHPGRRHCPAIGAAILAEPRGHFGMTLAEPPGGTPILMRTGKRRSAKTITSRALPGIPCSSFVLTYMARSPLAVQMNKPKPLRFLSLKHGRLGRRHDRVPRIGRYRSVQPLMPYHV